MTYLTDKQKKLLTELEERSTYYDRLGVIADTKSVQVTIAELKEIVALFKLKDQVIVKACEQRDESAMATISLQESNERWLNWNQELQKIMSGAE